MEQKRILIVEDESLVAHDLAQKLRNHGYEIIGVTASGRKAIELARITPPDLILMDVRIQGDLNGIETAIILRAQREGPVPIVFLTAFMPEEFPYLNVVDPYIYLNKPFNENELIDSIERALSAP